jgi:hypothetical protein
VEKANDGSGIESIQRTELDGSNKQSIVTSGSFAVQNFGSNLQVTQSGAAGPSGETGADGADGATGADGAAGTNGTNGTDGTQGIQGAPGAPGADGQGGITTAGTGINVTGAGIVENPYVVSTTSPCDLAIGQTYQGGIIFYLDASGCHGLIAAPSDQSTSAAWWNGSHIDTRAYGSGLFEGKYNTRIINYSQGGATSAAAICANYGDGKWYLPSIEELNLMYENIGEGNALGLGNIGGFGNAFYWSSTEIGSNGAWRQYFYNGPQDTIFKNGTCYVRAVRAF